MGISKYIEQAKERVRHLREAESSQVLATCTPGELLASLVDGVKHRSAKTKALIREFWDNSFFRNLGKIDWLQYQLTPILIASILINIFELASPLYINLVYTSILPSGSVESLALLTVGVVGLLIIAGWLKAMRLELTGGDGARIEHRKRLEALTHFTELQLKDVLKTSPSSHLERFNSINLLRDESALQAITTAIDLVFSLLFVVVLFLIGGSLGLIALGAIGIYFLRALHYARSFEIFSKRRDRLELERINYQSQLMAAIDKIKSNGLARFFLVGNQDRQEQLARQRIKNNVLTGQYQAFGYLMGQITLASLVTWGAFLVIQGQLLVGALAACLLLGGKILQPWQEGLGLWSSYRRLSHARQELAQLMALPAEAAGGSEQLEITGPIEISIAGKYIGGINRGSAILIRDKGGNGKGRQLFLNLIQIENDIDLSLNGVLITNYQREDLRQKIIYIDPGQQFFEGSLLENITRFQPNRLRSRALFWSVVIGTEEKVRSLPMGYETPLGNNGSSGLSKDSLQLFQLVRGMATSPELVLLDLSQCSYGKEFIHGLTKMLERNKGRTTVLITGAGSILQSLVDAVIELPNIPKQV
jgi:ABC-type bacteriocin/lantibiotic exporter with double-glycine peptidase domain